MCREHLVRAVILPVLLALAPIPARAQTAASPTGGLDVASASMETLIGWAQRAVTTPEKVRNRDLARDALYARGADSLRFCMAHLDLTNDTFGILAYDLVRVRLAPGISAPVLAEFLDDAHARTRRVAAYDLGFVDAPALAPRLLPLLEDEAASGAAARTLGKWKVREAVPPIIAMLAHPKEQRRIVAANALRDIGDPAAVPALIDALDDPVFTVRKTAARALVRLGRPAERPMVEALASHTGAGRRELVRALGEMRARRAVPALRKMLSADDPMLRRDAAQALESIDPRRAARWVRQN